MSAQNSLAPSVFDSQHYGLKVGKLVITSETKNIETTIRVGKLEGYDVLFIRVCLEDSAAFKTRLEKLGGKYINSIIHLKLAPVVKHSVDVSGVESYHEITSHRELEEISKICAESISQSHLYLDPRLPTERTRELHAAWARNNASGRCQQTLITRERGKITGFLNIKVANDEGLIDLLAVDKKYQGKGLGKQLIAGSVNWLAKNTRGAEVGTQNDNAAYFLYQKFGFKPYLKEDIYHLWLE